MLECLYPWRSNVVNNYDHDQDQGDKHTFSHRYNNCFLARTDPKDVARTEGRTFLCSDERRDSIPCVDTAQVMMHLAIVVTWRHFFDKTFPPWLLVVVLGRRQNRQCSSLWISIILCSIYVAQKQFPVPMACDLTHFFSKFSPDPGQAGQLDEPCRAWGECEQAVPWLYAGQDHVHDSF